MVIYCFVEGCKSTRYKRKYDENHINETFYGFPTDLDLREKWIEALFTLNKQESARRMPKSSKICKLHFSDDCFEQFGFSHVRLKPNSIPSKFPRMQNDSLDNQNHAMYNITYQRKESNRLTINVNDNSQKVNIIGKVDSIDSTIQLVKEVESINSMTPKTTFMDRLETENMKLELQYGTPECIEIRRTPTKKIRYPGDINEDTIKDMTPHTKIKSMKLLKRACVKKDHTIKQLRNAQHRQKKKIESLQTLLMELKQKCLLSSNSSDIVEVWSKELNKFKFCSSNTGS